MLRSTCCCICIMFASANAVFGQSRLQDIPPGFLGAQRGHLTVGPHGSFHMRFGRGLTPEGGQVLTTGITTIGPLLPSIIAGAAPGVLTNTNSAPGPSNNPSNAPAKCMVADEKLDRIARASSHSIRLTNLKELEELMGPALTKFDIKSPTNKESGNNAGDGIDPKGGMEVTPPSDPSGS